MSPPIHVVYADPQQFSAAQVQALRGLLSPVEEARRQRFLRPHLSHDFVVAHALVRQTLGKVLGRPAEALRFSFNPHGRPHIEGVHFNLSHTEGCVALAYSHTVNIGVDVEAIKPRPFDALAAHHFAPDEVSALANAADTTMHFYATWTLKEAYIKARGLGLAIPLDGFGFSLSPLGFFIDPSKVQDQPSRWSFAQLSPTAGVAGAIAFERSELPPFSQRWIGPDALR